jgi:hypothetical protein
MAIGRILTGWQVALTSGPDQQQLSNGIAKQLERSCHIRNFLDYLLRPHDVISAACMHLKEQFDCRKLRVNDRISSE